eukprot:Phypoly_transcript_10028.p1 GENE.Phypoly_transcript_10028~~Phypoly_transcript_10028.p1  ORF type:complete len:221 (+),score=32.90 Phypoly_transcript_10028:524-1186(+)
MRRVMKEEGRGNGEETMESGKGGEERHQGKLTLYFILFYFFFNFIYVYFYKQNSRKYDSYGFEKAAIDFITLQFDDYFLLDMESELHYLTFDMLLNVITSDTLLLSCEMKVLEAIKIWGKEDDDETVAKHLKGGKKCKMNPREQHVPKLLQQVRFPLMSASQLHQVENDADVMKYSIMKDLLIEAWKARAKDPPLDPANPRYQKRKYLFSLSRKKKCTKN